MEHHDIFISYRRQDAEAHAYMLYRDLTAAGYSVFYDHKSLGAGDFIERIEKTIEQCNDVIVILSKDALGERIYQEKDVMRREIAYALQMEKRIVGIMLSGFEGFPEDLPEEIAALPRINALYSKMEYYDAMFERLISGRFLISVPESQRQWAELPSETRDKQSSLARFKELPLAQKNSYVDLLLKLAHEFNSSPECMRLYRYLDIYDRSRGIQSIPPYEGVIPTDYATYLSFFETMYVILATETLDIGLVDEMYRYRFFAMCNNPMIQASELLPLGYQYPNVLDLYDLWSEHIRRQYCGVEQDGSFAEAIPLAEYDLHRRYQLYRFAMNPSRPRRIRFVNGKADKIELVCRLLVPADLEAVKAFQENVLAGIPDNDTENLFEALTEAELCEALAGQYCVGFYEEERLAALLSVIPYPKHTSNLLCDLEEWDGEDRNKNMVVDCVLVDEAYRGFGIQRNQLFLAECMARRLEIPLLCAVASPKNFYSIRNFIKTGYRNVATMPKYHSTRSYFVKELEEW